MILLRWRSMEPIRKVPLESMSLELSERESTASITPADMTGISLDSWLQDETEPGKGIVWRVRNIRNDYTNDTPEVELEHVVNSLKDDLLFGEITPAVITGDAKATVCTARQAVEYILSKQTSKDWVLGTFDYGNVSNAYKFDGDSLFDALEEVTKTLEGARWSYGLGGYPFKLNITRKTDTVESELRPARNLQTITKTVDKSGMYTRIYPIGYDDLHLSGTGYIERNVNLYGLVSHTETDTSRKTEAELRAWAETRLAVHCEPKVTIEVDGLELAEATGVPLDKLWLGFRCRIPLWEFGTEITERIESLSYPDKLNQPEVVQITLANEREDVTRIIADLMKSGGKGGRSAAREAKEDHAWMVDTDTHVGLVAESIAGKDGVDWRRFSELFVDGDGIHARVETTEGRVGTLEVNEVEIRGRVEDAEGNIGTLTVRADLIEERVSDAEGNIGTLTVRADEIEGRVETAEGNIGTLEITAKSLTGRVTTAEGNIGELQITANSLTGSVSELVDENTRIEGKLVVTAGSAGLTASLTDDREVLAYTNSGKFPATGDANYLYYDKTDKIYYEWKNNHYVACAGPGATIAAGDICVAINESGESEATINASKIYLLGQTIANTITADYINSKIADMASVVISNLSVTSDLKVSTGQYEQSVKGAVWDLNLVNNQDGSYTLQRKRFNDSAWVDVGTFSRATTPPTLSGSWSGGTLTVTSNPAPVSTFQRALSAGAKEKADGTAYDGGTTFYVPIQSYETGVTPPTYENTGYRAYVDATLTYNNGRSAGMHEYYTSGNWAKATSTNDWYAMIPTETNSGSEPWDCGAIDAYTAAANAVVWPAQVSGQSSHVNFSFTVPNTSLGTSSRTYTLSKDSAGCYVTHNNTLVAVLLF